MQFYIKQLDYFNAHSHEPVHAQSPEDALKTINPSLDLSTVSITPNETLKNLVDMGITGLPARFPDAEVYLLTFQGYKSKYAIYQIE